MYLKCCLINFRVLKIKFVACYGQFDSLALFIDNILKL